MTARRAAAAVCLLHAALFGLGRCKHADGETALKDDEAFTGDLAADERLVTILGTNDVHGALEPVEKNGKKTGGLAFWGGVVTKIRADLAAAHGERAGALLVDAGDQFQGTLLSNNDEGVTAFAAMSAIGYDAAVPGNHDYDFGPVGWLEDVVLPETPQELADRQGAFRKAIAAANFPLLSANTYLRSSLKTTAGAPVVVKSHGCEPEGGAAIDWASARRPDFVKAAVVKTAGGVRVALIGLDNEATAETTMSQNVSDLCFRDLVVEWKAQRAALAGEADVFVMITHEGDLANKDNFRSRIEALLAEDARAVDAIVAGHSHQVQRLDFGGVPLIQSGSGGQRYGRIDLVWSETQKAVVKAKTKFAGGTLLTHEGGPAPHAAVAAMIDAQRAKVSPLASKKIGQAAAEVKRGWKGESPLVNTVADLLREATSSDLAFINSATVRDTLPKGELTYEHLFKVLPFSSRTVRVKPVPRATVLQLARDVVALDGAYGVISQSGMRLAYKKTGSTVKLMEVKLLDGTVLMANGVPTNAGPETYKTVVIDYLADPVSGVASLVALPKDGDAGVVRELIAARLFANPKNFPTAIDGRLKEL